MRNPVWRVSQEILKYCRQGGSVYVSGQLRITVEVKNLAPVKLVGIHYTSNHWKSRKVSHGTWCSHNVGFDSDQFLVLSESTITPGSRLEYAIFYTASGMTYWDNNSGANYQAQF